MENALTKSLVITSVCFLPCPSLSRKQPCMCSFPGKWEFYSVAARGCAGIEPGKGAAPDQPAQGGRDAFGIGQNAWISGCLKRELASCPPG